ncbi:MAG: putative rane protein YphA, DoxX/SURF4 family [Candidatus Eremiobacteraeota bacterium]|jgi:putative oxidoreductase|nr:putative rane protein YphA, DoxX/SURF4 family [Candidatus Eremiobacteraeota bacterium]
MRDTAFLILRLGLAIVMFPHGAQKALGWFGGEGISATVSGLTTAMHLPAVVAYLVIAAEFVGPILLVLGVLTRLAALAIGVDMFFAAVLVHAQNGFFLNFSGHQAGEGIEYHIALITIALALVIGGAGRFAVLPRT